MENNIVKDDKSLELATTAINSIELAETRKTETTAVDIVETTVAEFLGKAIAATLESNHLSRALEESLEQDLSEMSTSEKITLFNIDRSSTNDKWFKILSPTIGLLTARQQALIQAASKEAQQAAVQVNVGTAGAANSVDGRIAASNSPEVNSGMNTIFQLIASRQADLEKAKAVDVEANTEEEENKE